MRIRANAVSILSGLALLAFATGRRATAADPSLVELLTSAGEYVLAYEDAFRVVVAEEVYVQRLRASPGGPVQQTRRLGSDVALVRASGAALPWWLLRDVYEVDGGAVRDRPDVLALGRVWIHDGRHGTVGRTELVLDLAGDGIRTRATLDTEYQPRRALALWIPVEMRDRLQTELAGQRGRSGSVELVEGLAAYTGFRQAGVTTQEEFRAKEPDPR